ncbi:MAG: hypothetical protein F6K35_15670 [Okeania sp. SIO2H7]|nr:hypothetical protein [Okeania sp. SIO2H7]
MVVHSNGKGSTGVWGDGGWGDGDPPLTPPVEGNLGRWGDEECGRN